MSSALARRRSRSEPAPSFALRHAWAGVHRLNPNLMINGITVAPILCYRAIDCVGATWPAFLGYGPTLSLTGTGAAPALGAGSPLPGSLDVGVRAVPSAKYYSAGADTTTGNLGDDDFVVEYIGDTCIAGYGEAFGKDPNSSGWWGFRNAATNNSLLLASASVALLTGYFATPTWNHNLFFVNRDENSTNGAAAYVNAILTDAKNMSAVPTLDTVGTAFKIFRGYYDQSTFCLSMVTVWRWPSWHRAGAAGPAEWATIAKSRFAALMGGPTVAQGSAVPDVMARSTPAYVDKWEASGTRRIYYVGASWPSLHSRKDSAGRVAIGVAPDLARTNLALQSQALNTTWTKVALTSITNDSGVGPDGTAVLDGIIGDATDAFHGVSQAITLTAVTYCLSAWFRAGNKSWAYIDDTTVASATGYFNLATGVVGTKGAGAGTIGIEDWGGGLYRCWITVLGTAAAHTIRFGAAHADTDNDFAGDASTINTHIGCINVTAAEAPTAYVPTTTAAYTRTAETLRWPGLANLGGVGSEARGTLRFKVLATPPVTLSAVAALLGASKAGAAADSIGVTVGTDGFIDVVTAKTGGNAGASAGPATNVLDGALHDIVASWDTNRLVCWVDGVPGTTDTSVDPPTALDRLEIGQDCAGASQGRVLLIDVKAFPRPIWSPAIVGSGFR
jgi:hypothetical protein